MKERAGFALNLGILGTYSRTTLGQMVADGANWPDQWPELEGGRRPHADLRVRDALSKAIAKVGLPRRETIVFLLMQLKVHPKEGAF